MARREGGEVGGQLGREEGVVGDFDEVDLEGGQGSRMTLVRNLSDLG